jgi:hypothetical protein
VPRWCNIIRHGNDDMKPKAAQCGQDWLRSCEQVKASGTRSEAAKPWFLDVNPRLASALYQPCPSALETPCRHLPINLYISILSACPHHTPTAMNSLFSLRCLRSAAPQITASPATSQPSTILRALQQSRSFSSTPVPQKRNRGGPKKDTRIRKST